MKGRQGSGVGSQELGAERPTPEPQSLTPRSWHTVVIGDQSFLVPDDPLCLADAADPANHLLAEYAALRAGDVALVLGAGCGLLAAWVATRIAPGRLLLCDTHTSAFDRAGATLARNRCRHYELLPVEQLEQQAAGSFDVVLVNSAFQASSKALAAALRAAGRALRPGGRLYVAGAKAQGIGAIKSRLETIFGAASTLGYRKGVHVVVATRPEQLGALPAAPDEMIDVEVRGHVFRLALRDGVFARGGLDDGTRMLLEALEVRPADRALDLGCGSGLVGLLLARLAPQGHVDLLDSDSAAVALARENLRANSVSNAAAHVGDGVGAAPGAPYDLIATNPPFHLGRRQTTVVAQQFIAAAPRALGPGGRFFLVANRFLPYERDMLLSFGNMREVMRDGRFKVLLATREDLRVEGRG